MSITPISLGESNDMDDNPFLKILLDSVKDTSTPISEEVSALDYPPINLPEYIHIGHTSNAAGGSNSTKITIENITSDDVTNAKDEIDSIHEDLQIALGEDPIASNSKIIYSKEPTSVSITPTVTTDATPLVDTEENKVIVVTTVLKFCIKIIWFF